MKIYLVCHFIVHIILKDNLSSQDENHFPQDAQVREQHRPEHAAPQGPPRRPQRRDAARGQLRRQVRPLPPEVAQGDAVGEGGAALRRVRAARHLERVGGWGGDEEQAEGGPEGQGILPHDSQVGTIQPLNRQSFSLIIIIC